LRRYSEAPLLLVFDNFLSPDECHALMVGAGSRLTKYSI
jgi:hypothetical protein